MRLLTCAVVFLVACSTAPAATDTGPSMCIEELIAMQSAAPPGDPPYSVHRCSYRGATVYFFPAQCCDQYSALVDANCSPICAPSGGISGAGDGACPDFDMATCTQLWLDPRTP